MGELGVWAFLHKTIWRKGQPADSALMLSSHLLPPALS